MDERLIAARKFIGHGPGQDALIELLGMCVERIEQSKGKVIPTGGKGWMELRGEVKRLSERLDKIEKELGV